MPLNIKKRQFKMSTGLNLLPHPNSILTFVRCIFSILTLFYFSYAAVGLEWGDFATFSGSLLTLHFTYPPYLSGFHLCLPYKIEVTPLACVDYPRHKQNEKYCPTPLFGGPLHSASRAQRGARH